MKTDVITMNKKMTGYFKIQNSGEMDINAITLLGASSKRDDQTKIGFFGSGLKYALAVLLRNKIPVQIFSGVEEIKISTTEKIFRDQKFNVIQINNKETSLTTDMGVDWELWFAIREFHCNAIDEGGNTIGITDKPKGEKGKTNIFIGFTPEVRDIQTEWNKFFSENRTDLEVKASVFGGEDRAYTGSNNSLVVYRKGIRVYFEKEAKSLFHYDLSGIKINESRVVADSWEMRWKISEFIKKQATVSMASQILEAEDGNWGKEQIMWDYGNDFCENWLTAINGRTIIPKEFAGYFVEEMRGDELILPLKMVHPLKRTFKGKLKTKGIKDMKSEEGVIHLEANKEEMELIKEAVKILGKAGLEIDYNISVVAFEDERQLGEAKNGEIFISRKVFLLGFRELMATILEEFAHLHSGAGDKTRSFQTFLIQMYISNVEKQLAIRI